MKDKKKECTEKLFNKLKHSLQQNMLWFFANEKNFYLHQIMNSQNNCWLALPPQSVLIVMKTKHPFHSMVFGAITSGDDIMPPFIFPHNHGLNIEDNIKCLEEVELLWIERMAAWRSYIWQQDSVPHHTSRKTWSLQ